MALVTTSSAQNAALESFINPATEGGRRFPGTPIGKGHLRSTAVTVPAKDAADENLVSLTFVLPRNFAYRITSFSFTSVSTSVAVYTPATGFELGARGTVIVDGTDEFFVPLVNEVQRDLGVPAFKGFDDSVTNDFIAYFSDQGAFSHFMMFARTSLTIQARWMDTSADATAASSIVFSCEALQYTIDQALGYVPNAPVWTI